jgi:chromosome segregation ATPase
MTSLLTLWRSLACTVVFLVASANFSHAQYGLSSVLGNGGNKFSNAATDSDHSSDAAQSGSAKSDSPVGEFSKQLEDFQKSVPDLNKKIQDGASAIDSASDVSNAKAEIDSLREEVSTLLAAVSDNGPISQLGKKALDHIHDKIKTLSQENRFKPDEKQYLLDQWQRLQTETETATKELDDARSQFASLLQTLQSNEDFISELVEIRQAEKALDVIRGLTHDIRDASTQLNRLIGSIRPPGA